MGAIAVILILAGVWMVYAAVYNLAPIQTLAQIIQNPQNARQIVSEKRASISQGPLIGNVGTSTDPVVGTEGGGGPAIAQFALSQVGKPYVLGASGPDAWDCSGLTAAAVRFGTGVELPHSATRQYASSLGVSVSRDELQIGDIIFPTIGFGHCGVYTGNGMMVDAAYPGKGVVHREIFGFFGAKRFSAPRRGGGGTF